MDDWEEENIEQVLPATLKKELGKGMWDDEDADDQDVKDSWEDIEEEQVSKPSKEEPPAAEKTVAKPSVRGAAKKGKQVKEEVLAGPVTEKLRQQRLVEESDYKATAELLAKKVDEISLDNFIPKSENYFLEYAQLVSHKIRPYEKSHYYIGLLKAIVRHSMVSLKAADAKEIASSVQAIANEKLKAEKEAKAGKKKLGSKKKQINVGRPDDDMVGVYDVGDDYDFL